jgi:hypothetical protein
VSTDVDVSRPRARADLLAAAIDDRVVVYDQAARTSHVLNLTAAAFLDQCDGQQTIDQIAVDLGRAFDTDPDRIRTDLRQVVADLDDAGLLGDRSPDRPHPPDRERLPRPSELTALHHRLVDRRDWAWQSGTLVALGFSFDLSTDDPELGRHLERVLGPLRGTGEPRHRYVAAAGHQTNRRRRVEEIDATSEPRLDLTLDGRTIRRNLSRASLTSYLLWHINRLSVAATPDRVILHAAGAAAAARTVILPGSPESGKSTLVTALVQHGFSYLSDESVAVVPRSRVVEPYPKSITLDRGSWDVHASLRPSHPTADEFESGSWQVQPDDVRPDSIGSSGPVDLIIFPKYEAGAETTCTALSGVDTLVELLTHAFDFDTLGQLGLDTLTSLAEQIPAYRLVSSDLSRAVAAVDSLLGDLDSSSPSSL